MEASRGRKFIQSIDISNEHTIREEIGIPNFHLHGARETSRRSLKIQAQDVPSAVGSHPRTTNPETRGSAKASWRKLRAEGLGGAMRVQSGEECFRQRERPVRRPGGDAQHCPYRDWKEFGLAEARSAKQRQ